MKNFYYGVLIICSFFILTGMAEAALIVPLPDPYCNVSGISGGCDLTIGYKATDLPDITVGEDLWRYDYTFYDSTHADIYQDSAGHYAWNVTDNFHIGDYLTIEFGSKIVSYDPLREDLYTNIQAFTNSDWSVDVQYMDLGYYEYANYHALVDNPSLTGLGATFVWLGSGTPGSQSFAYVDGGSPSLEFDLYGDTMAVPEPSTLLLLGSGLVGLGFVRRKFKV